MKAIDKISMISLLVSDVIKSKTFYTDTLGFNAVKDYEQAGNRWVTILPPEAGMSITLTNCFEDLKPGTMKIYLSAPNLEAAYQELKSNGVKLNNEISNDPWGKWFSLDDPDGNHCLIVQS